MHDIKAIRQDPAAFDKAMKRRKLAPQSSAILKLDEERREVQTELQILQNVRNEKSKEIGAIKSKGGDASAIMEEVNALKGRMTELEVREATLAESLNQHLASLPNVQALDIPDGDGEEQNVEIRKVGEPKRQNEKIPEHSDIGEALDMMDFETAAKVSGSRFVFMCSGLARLERALAQFMLDTHVDEHGYREISPPLLVNDSTMFGTGQLPKFKDDQFQTTRGDWLIPTAEVPLTNILAGDILEEETLPRRYTAFTPCFRQEAGAAGKDTKGMIRQHQFYKVEMVSITSPEQSEEEHKRMTQCAENILKKLELPFRTIVLCTGDAGFSSYKTYDIEV